MKAPAPIEFHDELLTEYQALTGHPTIIADCNPLLNEGGYQDARDFVSWYMGWRAQFPPELAPTAAQLAAWRADPASRPEWAVDFKKKRIIFLDQMRSGVWHTTSSYLA